MKKNMNNVYLVEFQVRDGCVFHIIYEIIFREFARRLVRRCRDQAAREIAALIAFRKTSLE